MSDHKGVSLIVAAPPPAKTIIADRGYDSSAFRQVLVAKGIEPCIPSSRSREKPYPYVKALYRQRHTLRPMWTHILLRHLHRSSVIFWL